ncbi:hypothetical protein RhiirA4_499118 [Rhizophagus irregularis]|uniref:Core domain-containing protein n=1 Tax=Rhizophagus irregularis TaxID=588596 RepID=A0A2I1G3P5_9GLOM|nr:hypothetical protein RhiirA4_499118 [Rhizophagus irregularis]
MFFRYTKHQNLFFLRRSFHSSVISKSIITQLSPSKIITIPKTPQINNFFSFSLSRRYATTVIKNPQKDEEGNDMCIEITNRAVTQLKYISGQEKIFNNALRVAVDSGGCHGFQYFYDLIDSNSIKEDDVVFENDGVKVVIDEISLGLIKGSKIDYTEELIGSQFQVSDNPQAASGCGCGISFEIKVC